MEKKLNLTKVIFVLGVFVLTICLMVLLISRKTVTTTNTKKTSTQVTKKEVKKDETTTITISATGDCTLGKDEGFNYSTSFNAMYANKGPAYFMQNVKSVFDNDDLTIVNFEGTLTKRTTRASKTFAFKGDENYMEVLTKGGVDAVTFANNHDHDYGDGSYSDTINTFKKYKMPYASYSTVGYVKVKNKTIAMVAVYGENASRDIKNGIKEAKEKADIVICSIHSGIEGNNYANERQKTLAHLAVDEGASLVIGHHPHVLQGVEKYKDVYIAYSLGNFCFGGNKNPTDKDTAIMQKTFTFKNNKLVVDDNFKMIPARISSVDNRNDYQPKIATGNYKTNIINKLNKFSSSYNISFDEEGNVKAEN